MFLDVRLPDTIEKGAVGGASFNTTVITLSSGAEKRNINWSAPLARWDISYGIADKVHHDEFLNLFYLVQGKAIGFRFKDWTDYEIGRDVETYAETPQSIGVGTGAKTKFQIYKQYAIGANIYNRAITRPISSTFKVYLNTTLQTITTHYTINSSTGVITFVTAPGVGINVRVVGEFDIPVRFDSDQLQLTATLANQFSVNVIPIVELKETLEVI